MTSLLIRRVEGLKIGRDGECATMIRVETAGEKSGERGKRDVAFFGLSFGNYEIFI